MGPRRRLEALEKKSIWDEPSLTMLLPNEKHRLKLWTHLIYSFSADPGANAPKIPKSTSLEDTPYEKWMIPKKSVEKIQKNLHLFTSKVLQRFDSARGDTTKLLVQLQDGHEVETVIMRHNTHSTVCISSQIGCQMGCRFCATGTMGIIGDLTAGEIVEQLVHANNITKIRNVVFMGMGEPLNNYENVKLAVQFFIDSRRFSLSPRQVTVSTVGVPAAMRRLSDDLPLVNLALSLHAPNQEVRLKIVPSARGSPIRQLLEAVDYHVDKSIQHYTTSAVSYHKEMGYDEEKVATPNFNGEWQRSKFSSVMIEYILIAEVNDRDEHAAELAELLLPRREFILLNLIPYNPTAVAEDFKAPTQEQVARFAKICQDRGVHCRVRQEKGQDIAGACGQLALVNQAAQAKSNNVEVEEAAGRIPNHKHEQNKNCGHHTRCSTPPSSSSSPAPTLPPSPSSPSATLPVLTMASMPKPKSLSTTVGRGLPGAFLEDLSIASLQPVHTGPEGRNISDNSPVNEHAYDRATAMAKRNERWFGVSQGVMRMVGVTFALPTMMLLLKSVAIRR
jgi:adenine C2-methylase RlmN of 23S rRNA A2503 and tRNA A37